MGTHRDFSSTFNYCLHPSLMIQVDLQRPSAVENVISGLQKKAVNSYQARCQYTHEYHHIILGGRTVLELLRAPRRYSKRFPTGRLMLPSFNLFSTFVQELDSIAVRSNEVENSMNRMMTSATSAKARGWWWFTFSLTTKFCSEHFY